MHKRYVCQTCMRDEPLSPGRDTRGAQLDAALRQALGEQPVAGLTLVRVACLNGCLNPCNVSFRAPRKFALRLSRLTAADAADLLTLARRYLAHETGDLADDDWPEGLRERLSACVPPPHLLTG